MFSEHKEIRYCLKNLGILDLDKGIELIIQNWGKLKESLKIW